MTQMAMDQTMGAEGGADRWVAILKDLSEGRSLSQDQAGTLMQGWLAESVPPLLSGAILMALGGLLSLSDRRHRVAAGAARVRDPAQGVAAE